MKKSSCEPLTCDKLSHKDIVIASVGRLLNFSTSNVTFPSSLSCNPLPNLPLLTMRAHPCIVPALPLCDSS